MTDQIAEIPRSEEVPRSPVARVFTTLECADKPGQKQFFDVPLVHAADMPQFTPWAAFMTKLLLHRGLLVENAWIPERVINLILVNPQNGGLDPDKFDPNKIVMLRPPVA